MQETPEAMSIFRFGVFELDCRAHELRKSGSRVRLQDQPFQVLKLLLERAGDIVTREELRQRLWPASIYVDFDHGLNNAMARVREALGESAGTAVFIETVPRIGYRFVYPLDQPSNVPQERMHSGTAETAPLRSRSYWTRALVVTAMLASGALLFAWLKPGSDLAPSSPSAPPGPAIAVLPFANIGGDADAGHFADGLSEELLNTLAGIQGLRVVGRTQSHYFGAMDVPADEIAKRLKVDQYIEGSVRQAGLRVRVSVQLIDAANGFHRWSETYDRELADFLDVQEEIARAVADTLKVRLVEADERRLRSRGTNDAEAYRLFLIGTQLRYDARARSLLEEAIARDPEFSAAHSALADFHYRKAWVDLESPELSFALGLAAAQRAIALDPESADAHRVMANFESWRARFRDDSNARNKAGRHCQRAMLLDPSNFRVYFDCARAVEWDDPGLALRNYEHAAELSPLADLAIARAVIHRNRHGSYDVSRKALEAVVASSLDPRTTNARAALGFLALDFGRLDEALIHFSASRESSLSPEVARTLWSIYMSLGDRQAARLALSHPRTDVAEVLYEAAALSMEGRAHDALALLDRHRNEYPQSRVLDAPTARLALITGNSERAVAILEERLPNLAHTAQPVTARTVMPALDLATAYGAEGRHEAAKDILKRIGTFLDGPNAPRLPMFAYLRARAHALAGDREAALAALERAYHEGFRTIWAPDLNPQPLLYVDSIDSEPAFATLRTDPRYTTWRARIAADNARQLKQFRAREAATPLT